MSLLLHGDCLEQMKSIDTQSVDLIFCDLPYGQTSCKWDCKIDLDKFWIEVMRIKKINTPIFMTTTTKFGVELINSAPKKCPFRYDLVWVKSAPAGFLSAKKMPMRKHEMVYVFYEKLPFYDLSSHTHKFLKEGKKSEGDKGNECYGKFKYYNNGEKGYEPPLPVSVVKECKIVKRTDEGCNGLYGKEENKVFIYDENGKLRNSEPRYEPPLPTSVVKEETMNTLYGEIEIKELDTPRKDRTSAYDPPLPVSVIKGENNTYNTEGRKKPITREPPNKYDPPLPVSVVKEEIKDGAVNENYDGIYGGLNQPDYVSNNIERNKLRRQYKKEGGSESAYDPPLPTTMLEIKSTRGKHSTEKPVALMEWLLKYYSKEGDVVLDPTMGSGSTGVACKNMNRNFIGIEKDPEIYEVAVNRID
jgi:DNA modification methylase